MYNWSVRPCYDCWWYSGNHRWTRTLPIGLPRSTSRKMVLFVPRPWYRCCCRHIWQATHWHALLSWPCKMSAPFLLSTTWWAHNPQFHRIETWLSYTPYCQRYSSCLTLYVIHGPLACWSILVSDTILIPVAQNPFRTLLQAMNDCLSAWKFLLHRLTLLSMCFVCSAREILICSYLGKL